LVNLMAEANGMDDKELARSYASSAFYTLLLLTVILTAASLATFTRIPWPVVFRTSDSVPIRELQLACALALISFLLTLPLNMLTSLYNAYQDGFVANIWTIASNIGAISCLVAATQMHGGLPELVLAVSGAKVILGFANGYYLFFVRYRWLRPAPSSVSWKHIKRLIKLGSKYMVAQISGLALSQSQPIIITQTLGPAQVPIFVVAYRLLSLPFNLILLSNSPLVAAYGEAKARGDWVWIKGTLKQSTILSFGIGFAVTVLLACFSRPVIQLWVGSGTVPSVLLVVWLTIYSLLAISMIPVAQMLSGMERIGVQAITLGFCAFATIRLGITFIQFWGLAGLAGAMSLSFFCTYCAGQVYEVRRTLNDMRAPGNGAKAYIQPVEI